MVASTSAFSQWLAQASIREAALSADQLGLLRAAFRFRQDQGEDYYSTRLLGHFLLHCGCGLKIATLARLLGLSRPTASKQQKLTSKQAIQQAHHRMDGRPYGKLLPRYAGPIAGFLLGHPDATRADLIDFVDRTFSVRVSRIALYKFLKKYGLDQIPQAAQGAAPAGSPADTSSPAPVLAAAVPVSVPLTLPGMLPATGPAPPFSSHGRITPAPSC
jgi:hypothetical protein